MPSRAAPGLDTDRADRACSKAGGGVRVQGYQACSDSRERRGALVAKAGNGERIHVASCDFATSRVISIVIRFGGSAIFLTRLQTAVALPVEAAVVPPRGHVAHDSKRRRRCSEFRATLQINRHRTAQTTGGIYREAITLLGNISL